MIAPTFAVSGYGINRTGGRRVRRGRSGRGFRAVASPGSFRIRLEPANKMVEGSRTADRPLGYNILCTIYDGPHSFETSGRRYYRADACQTRRRCRVWPARAPRHRIENPGDAHVRVLSRQLSLVLQHAGRHRGGWPGWRREPHSRATPRARRRRRGVVPRMVLAGGHSRDARRGQRGERRIGKAQPSITFSQASTIPFPSTLYPRASRSGSHATGPCSRLSRKAARDRAKVSSGFWCPMRLVPTCRPILCPPHTAPPPGRRQSFFAGWTRQRRSRPFVSATPWLLAVSAASRSTRRALARHCAWASSPHASTTKFQSQRRSTICNRARTWSRPGSE